jgi:hypothetical protein
MDTINEFGERVVFMCTERPIIRAIGELII